MLFSRTEGKWITFLFSLTEAVKNINSGQMALLAVKGINLFPSSNEKLKGTIDVWWIVHILINKNENAMK